jgi:hypothetical protein
MGWNDTGREAAAAADTGSQGTGTDERAERRRLAAGFFNRVWELLERQDRTREQDDEMLHGAHASRALWAGTGTTANLVRGEWQCSRVYAVLSRAEPALWHARRCLELAEAAEPGALADFDLPFAYEALARANALAGDREQALSWLERGAEAALRIADADDRELVATDLKDVRGQL